MKELQNAQMPKLFTLPSRSSIYRKWFTLHWTIQLFKFARKGPYPANINVWLLLL